MGVAILFLFVSLLLLPIIINILTGSLLFLLGMDDFLVDLPSGQLMLVHIEISASISIETR